jgi:hypothetical protein
MYYASRGVRHDACGVSSAHFQLTEGEHDDEPNSADRIFASSRRDHGRRIGRACAPLEELNKRRPRSRELADKK